MSLEPRQPVALVTGGMRGIGAAIRDALLERGYRVIVADISVSGAASGRLSSLPEAVTRVECDVSDAASVAAAIRAVEGLTDRLDALVNNAGVGSARRSADLSEADWSRVMDINAGGMYRMSRASYPLLKTAGRSSITSITSINAHMGVPGRLAYSASKAAMEAMTRVLAVEWAPAGIRVNAVAPGYTDTEMGREIAANGIADVEARAARALVGRYAEPAEIGRIVAWLAGADASYISGQVIVADAGLLINGRHGRDATFE
ncbi:MAG TPA: SDR family oxidoreductase [Candidatus Limnocylindrales bacterium]|jgi:NAD(P)-dependent dehydrogenase (short-subunit alcohol dehydrogenase family)|nr:SDR family oxidoreductase [Candidatus Limnocylindrales bacterium]